MALPTFTMRQLLEAGVHFGHNTRRWNPKMAPYLFGVRNKIHIIDLEKTVPLLHQAMVAVRDVVAAGGRVLFVGTKRQATNKISEAAKRCGQYYVNHRWLGGMMTNWRTISNSIKRLRDLDEQLAGETVGLTKKELLGLTRERAKLERALGGIKEMGALPDILVVIDTNKEAIAVAEANKLNIPVVGIMDSNSKPEGIDFPVPGNDDAIRAIDLYCELMVGAVLDGIQQEVTSAGKDLGESPEGPVEKLPNEVKEPVKAQAKKSEERGQKKGEEKAEEKSATKAIKPAAAKKDKPADKPAAKKEPAPAKKKEPAKAKKSEPEKMAKKDPPAAKGDDDEGGKKADADKGKEKDKK
ncbi:MAG: 30S ribosomal protein S2 [Proteobacteria bacterium]|nr:30S ribosomal protein S2 [Pseudomonadota bacterium]